jgi:hypothetical protein
MIDSFSKPIWAEIFQPYLDSAFFRFVLLSEDHVGPLHLTPLSYVPFRSPGSHWRSTGKVETSSSLSRFRHAWRRPASGCPPENQGKKGAQIVPAALTTGRPCDLKYSTFNKSVIDSLGRRLSVSCFLSRVFR